MYTKKFFVGFLMIVIISGGILLTAMSAQAAGPLGDATGNLNKALGETGLQGGDENALPSMVGLVVQGVLGLVGTIFLVLTVYAGILWMTAQGNDEQVTKATGIIKTAVIGLFITMSAYAITYFVAAKLGGESKEDVKGCCVGNAGTASANVCASQQTSCSDQATFASGVCPNTCTNESERGK